MDRLPIAVQQLLDARRDKKWVSFSWITFRALVSSSNHAVNMAARGLVGDLRREWDTRFAADADRIIALPHVERFIVMGDPGEQDASQYVVVPPLLDEAAKGIGFTLICSDVIYPSGDVNDYVDGLYVPYADLPRPIYALPGNHDWYDGLAGFMYHFCDEPALPAAAYHAGAGSLRERFYRRLWRRPSAPNRRKLARAPNPATREPADPRQPGSYFAIETRHLLVVCIDTGISGDIDAAQAQWLLRLPEVSQKPKLLVTGKPVIVNMQHSPHRIVDLEGNETTVGGYRDVDQIIRDGAQGYVATIGGDIHNYQHYTVERRAQPPFHYVVSGGGGAYMSATHPVPTTGEALPYPLVAPPELYPSRPDSLRYFADRLLPRLWRLVRAVIALLVGLGAATAWALDSNDHEQTLRLATYAAWAVAAAGAIQVLLPYKAKRGSAYRGFVVVAAAIAGVAVGLGGWWLDESGYGTYVVAWVGLTVGGAMLAWAMRRSGWWRERGPDVGLQRAWPPVAFGVTLALTVCVWVVTTDLVVRLAAVLTALAAIGGWLARSWDRWSQGVAQVVAYLVQLIDALVVLDRLVVPRDARDAFRAGVGATLGAGLVGAALTAVAAWLLARRRPDAGFRDRALTLVPVLGLPSAALSTAAVIWIAVGAGADAARATVSCVAVFASLLAVPFGVDFLRRRFGRAGPYLPVILLAVWIAVAHFQWFGVGGLPTWVAHAVAAASIIAGMTLVGIVIVHLVFLSAHSMVWHRRSHRETSQLTLAQATAIVEWRNSASSAVPDRKTRWIANLVFPGTTRPHGPIQQFVAEIFDSDNPPFFKNFLVLESDGTALNVTPHLVTGGHDMASERPEPFTIELASG